MSLERYPRREKPRECLKAARHALQPMLVLLGSRLAACQIITGFHPAAARETARRCTHPCDYCSSFGVDLPSLPATSSRTNKSTQRKSI